MPWTDLIAPHLHLCWSGTWRVGTVEAPRLITDHLLVIVPRGRCLIEIGDATHDLSDGGFVVIPPHVRHVSRIVGGPCTRCCVHFDWAWNGEPPRGSLWTFDLAKAASLPLRPPPPWLPPGILSGRASPAAVSLFQRLIVRWRAGERSAPRGLALELLLALFTEPETRSAPDRATDLAWQVKERLDAGGLDDVSLRAELRRIGHSYEYLCRCFVRTFRIPPLRYLQLAKVERAKGLLAAGGATVGEVAAQLGYRDTNHFSRIFRAVTGTTPGRWGR